MAARITRGETSDTNRLKKEWLIEEFKKIEIARDQNQICQYMIDTYTRQRDVINHKMVLVLIYPAGSISHFKILP